MIRFNLPIPPPTNNLFATGRSGRRFVSKRYAEWRTDACWRLQMQTRATITGPYCITVALPMKMAGDVDGRLKAPLDLLVSLGITPDDKHCVRATAERSNDVEKGQCVVTIEAAA